MKRLHVLSLMLVSTITGAASTIDSVNRFACGANIGWMDWRADYTHGAIVGEYVCSGYIYAANVGVWISLGNGTPANGVRYQNNSPTDCGVNHDGAGNLRGLAYGANVGWINFEDLGAAKIDLCTGKFSGSIYGANVGWIGLSDAVAFVQTITMPPGADTDHNGLSDAWERQHFGLIGVNPNADADGDGYSNLQEYLADTDPLNADSNLRITRFARLANGNLQITWTSTATRKYNVLERANFQPATPWVVNLGSVPADTGNTTTRAVNGTVAMERYFEVQALRLLSP